MLPNDTIGDSSEDQPVHQKEMKPDQPVSRDQDNDAPGVGELASDDPSVQQQEDNMHITLNGVTHQVKVSPFVFNDETRYYVSVDDGPTNLFLWDTDMNQIKSLDDSASALPEGLEKAISEKLMRMEDEEEK